jgi:hypothetical protein
VNVKIGTNFQPIFIRYKQPRSSFPVKKSAAKTALFYFDKKGFQIDSVFECVAQSANKFYGFKRFKAHKWLIPLKQALFWHMESYS